MNWFNSKESYVPSFRLGHDIIDHYINDQIGEIEQEFMAYGSIVYNTSGFEIYIQNGRVDYYKDFNFSKNDFLNFFSDFWMELGFCEIKNTKCKKEDFLYIKNIFNSVFDSDFKSRFIAYCLTDDEVKDNDEYIYNNTIEKTLKWVTRGYTHAKNKYKNFDPFEILMIKGIINSAGDRIEQRIDLSDIGKEVVLNYDISHAYAEFTL